MHIIVWLERLFRDTLFISTITQKCEWAFARSFTRPHPLTTFHRSTATSIHTRYCVFTFVVDNNKLYNIMALYSIYSHKFERQKHAHTLLESDFFRVWCAFFLPRYSVSALGVFLVFVSILLFAFKVYQTHHTQAHKVRVPVHIKVYIPRANCELYHQHHTITTDNSK